jgi:hypothetical protein
MKILRNILAVIAGYVTFAASAVLLFQLSGIDPHGHPSNGFVILSVAYGMLFSFIGGLLTQLISKAGKLTINYVLAVVIAGFAAFSLLMSGGNHYSQLSAIFLFAPSSILGGQTYLRKVKKS